MASVFSPFYRSIISPLFFYFASSILHSSIINFYSSIQTYSQYLSQAFLYIYYCSLLLNYSDNYIRKFHHTKIASDYHSINTMVHINIFLDIIQSIFFFTHSFLYSYSIEFPLFMDMPM